MALANIIKGTSGIVILVVVSIIVIFLTVYAIYAYIQNCMGARDSSNTSAEIIKNHRYSVLDFPDPLTSPLGVKTNTIQPPYQARVKVKLIQATNPQRSARKSIKYLDLSEDEREEVEKKIEEQKKLEEIQNTPSPTEEGPTIGQSIHAYRNKITEFLLNKSQPNRGNDYNEESADDDETNNKEPGIWRPEPVVISLDKRNSVSFNNLSRIKRPDSVLLNEKSLGRLTFVLYYSVEEEYLTILLISGRQINSCDPSYTIRLPTVKIGIENSPFSEFVSNPDEAPNPEYDQEFTFTLRPKDLHDMSLRFTVWDLVSNNESRIVGFFRVSLSKFLRKLLDGVETGTICREIQPFLNPPNDLLGQVLISLLYDCVTDKIFVTIHQCKQLSLQEDDNDVYLKVSLLLDNDIISSKRSITFAAKPEINLRECFEFRALSNELDKMPTVSSPTLQVADELLKNASSNYKKSLILDDIKSVRDTFASDTVRNHMGILISVRTSTGDKNKRVLGRLYIGRSEFHMNGQITDEQFHWDAMIRNFDNNITKWHYLTLDNDPV